MAFDPRRYEDEVVKPLRKKEARLPDDLATRYAVEPGMSRADLERRLREVRAYWHNKARSNTNIGNVCSAFLRADEKLQVEHGSALLDPAWWRRYTDDWISSRPAVVAPLIEDLRRSFGDLGAVTTVQLGAVARPHPDVSEAEADTAAREAGLVVVPVRELPRPGPPIRDAYRAVADGLVAAGVRSIPELLHPDCSEFRLLEGFDAVPPPRGALDAAAVAARAETVAKARDSATSGPTRHVLGRLRLAAEQGVDLEELALAHLLEEPRASRAAGAVPSGLVRILRNAGVAEDEARMLVVHLLAETVASADPLEGLRDLLAEGQVVAAGRLVSGLGEPAGTEGRALVAARNAEVDALRDQAAEAVRTDRPDVAEQKLRVALDMAVDRTDLAEELARLPLVAVRDVDAAADGSGVRVSWVAPTSHHDDTHYRVVRRADRSPRDAADGHVVATVTGRGFVADPAPPVGRTLHYAVLAGRGPEGPWSSPAVTTVRVVPPVSDVEIVAEQAAVVVRWTAHPEVLRVRVRRFDRPPAPGAVHTEVAAGPRSFSDTEVAEGAQYHYEIVALYAAPNGGRQLPAEAVVRRGGLRAASAPVVDLEVEADGDEVEQRVVLRWRTPPGADVVLHAGRTPPPGRPGDRVPAEESWGHALDAVPCEEGDWTVLRVQVPSGRMHYAAYTRGPAGYVRGADRVFDRVSPPRRVRAQRRGETTVLSWLWPDDVRIAEVRWRGGSARVGHAQYLAQGGLTVPPGVSGSIEVRTVVGSGVEQSVSAPVVVEVSALRAPVRYQLSQEGSRLRGTRECVVSIPPGQGEGIAEIVLVAAHGHVMPLTAAAGEELGRVAVDLSAPETAQLRVPFPRLRKPYWLRCFPEGDDVVLIDPPVSGLKVS